MKKIVVLLLELFLSLGHVPEVQRKSKKETPKKAALESVSISGLKWRIIGPALTSGRISGFAFNPTYEYYAAISSGGLWKTINSGVTYQPIFDS